MVWGGLVLALWLLYCSLAIVLFCVCRGYLAGLRFELGWLLVVDVVDLLAFGVLVT